MKDLNMQFLLLTQIWWPKVFLLLKTLPCSLANITSGFVPQKRCTVASSILYCFSVRQALARLIHLCFLLFLNYSVILSYTQPSILPPSLPPSCTRNVTKHLQFKMAKRTFPSAEPTPTISLHPCFMLVLSDENEIFKTEPLKDVPW